MARAELKSYEIANDDEGSYGSEVALIKIDELRLGTMRLMRRIRHAFKQMLTKTSNQQRMFVTHECQP